jgi:hypothetical protein
MLQIAFIVAFLLVVVAAFALVGVMCWGTHWGATAEECALEMPGDTYLAGGPSARVSMTRAVSIAAPPETVWPWLAQMGRGAGWYSYDSLDNRGRVSAQHLVSWIPEPRLGDATPIGYLRHLEPGRALVWWVPGVRFVGALARLVVDMRLRPEGKGSRLIIRMSGDAAGRLGPLGMGVFRCLDAIMAHQQLLGIRERVERYGTRTVDLNREETGARDQFQLYEVIYASGERAGVSGREHAALWHQKAVEEGVIPG